jgi:hypothetical protein
MPRTLLAAAHAISLFADTVPLYAHGPATNASRTADATPEEASLTSEQWRRDLRVLAAELPRVHPHPFHDVSEADWRAAVADLDARIPSLSRNQVTVELMRLVARIGEGHTALNPLYRAEMGWHYLPVLPHVFADGLYVRSATPEHARLAGARIVRIGKLPADEAFHAVAAVVAHDNDSGARAAVPFFLVMPEMLDGLGIAPAGRPVPLELERDGRRFTVELETAGALSPRGHGAFGSAMDRTGWVDARPATAPTPLAFAEPTRIYWSRDLPEARTAYLQYNAVVDMPDEPIAAFFPRAIAAASASAADRLVIDVRNNGGGNNFLNRPIVKAVIRSRFDERGRLFVIVGRGTFSAAQNFVNDMARWTNAIFVGEPTASRPNQCGDHAEVRLPESGYGVMVSTLCYGDAGPRDRRLATAPQIPAEPTLAHYVAGEDPALAAVIGYRSIVAALEPALATGDLAAVAAAHRAFKSAPATAWIPTEVEINGLGYRLLGEGKAEAAVAILALNAEAYPRSANAHDSLGEAALAAGDHARAVASYRKALELDPHLGSAREALTRLGVPVP